MKYRNIFFVLLSMLALGWFVYYCSDILLWIGLGWIVSLLGLPIMNFLGKIQIKGKGLPSSIRAGIVIVGFYAIVALALWWVVPSIWKQAQNLTKVNYTAIIKSLDEPISHANDWLVEHGLIEGELSKYSLQDGESVGVEVENEKKSENLNFKTPNSSDSASIVNIHPLIIEDTVENSVPNLLHSSLQNTDGRYYLLLDTLKLSINLLDSIWNHDDNLFTIANLKTDSIAIYEKDKKTPKWVDEVEIRLNVQLENFKPYTTEADIVSDSALLVQESDTPLEMIQKKVISFVNPSGLITTVATSVVNMLGNFMMLITSVTFIAFFFLKDHNLLGRTIKGAMPDKYSPKTDAALSQIKYLLTRYFGGIVIQVSIITVYVTTCMWIFGISNGLLIGSVAALMNIIPYIGPLLGGMFAILVTISSNLDLDFYTEMVPLLITVFGIFVSLQLLDNFILQPVIFSNSIMAHPLEIFIVVIIGAKIGGIFAMICALPLYTIFRVIAASFLSEFKVVQQLTHKLKNSTIDTEQVSHSHPEDFQ